MRVRISGLLGELGFHCLLSLFVIPCFVSAQSPALPPLVPDRPGFYCGSRTVSPGAFQLETGVAFERSTTDRSRSESVQTPFVLRFGLSRDFELRVVGAGVPKSDQITPGSTTSETGFSSPVVGLKWQFADGGETLGQPSMAFLFSLNLPAGSRAFRPDKVEPTFNFASDFSLNDRTSLSTNIGINVPFDATRDERFSELFFAAALGRSITPRSAWFVEIFGVAPRSDGTDSTLLADGGVTFLVNNDVQLDVSLTRGLNGTSPDWIVAGGISIRFY